MENNNGRDVIIIKIGGSVFSDKRIPYSFHDGVVKQLISQISSYLHKYPSKKIILVHGGGSFGHPIANKYKIQYGRNQNIPNQMQGLVETHHVMVNLNKKFLEISHNAGLNTCTFPPSQSFHYENMPEQDLKYISPTTLPQSHLIFIGKKQIIYLLDDYIIPVIYGDIIHINEDQFSIISGDRIISKLCEVFPSQIAQVIFTIDKDGILSPDNDSKILQRINKNEISNVIS